MDEMMVRLLVLLGIVIGGGLALLLIAGAVIAWFSETKKQAKEKYDMNLTLSLSFFTLLITMIVSGILFMNTSYKAVVIDQYGFEYVTRVDVEKTSDWRSVSNALATEISFKTISENENADAIQKQNWQEIDGIFSNKSFPNDVKKELESHNYKLIKREDTLPNKLSVLLLIVGLFIAYKLNKSKSNNKFAINFTVLQVFSLVFSILIVAAFFVLFSEKKSNLTRK